MSHIETMAEYLGSSGAFPSSHIAKPDGAASKQPASSQQAASKQKSCLLEIQQAASKLKNDLLDFQQAGKLLAGSLQHPIGFRLLLADEVSKQPASSQQAGGRARAKKLTPERRREIARLGATARQAKRSST